ncbi:MAG: shikimate kinase AroL [Desulfonauticus sp.]|nr:shikimate kinase AroL [Desulfonauticus sp.]
MGKQVKNIYLIGPRASGKTTIGKLLARKINFNFLDTDELIVQKFGKTIQELVQNRGWTYFREQEQKILLELGSKNSCVIATGGGIVVTPAAKIFLRSQDYTFYLKISPTTALKRLSANQNQKMRPALTDLDWEKEVKIIMQERESLYQECAKYVLDAEQPKENIVQKIIEEISNERR